MPPGINTSWSGRRRSFPSRTRRRILRRDRTCQICHAAPAVIADHVVNHAEAIRLGWTPGRIDHEDNGQGVCAPCHDVKTRHEQARGRARTARHREPESHPGLITEGSGGAPPPSP